MTDQHPITPSRELVNKWLHKPEFAQPGLSNLVAITTNKLNQICADATQWGYDQRGKVNEAELQEARDQELEACIEVIESGRWFANPVHRIVELRAARRPKPPSLKKQALQVLGSPIMSGESRLIGHRDHDLLRRVLEALPDNDWPITCTPFNQ